MDPIEEPESSQLAPLAAIFRDQLLACLEECAQGRKGLFSDLELADPDAPAWPEAARLRELALALQGICAQQNQPSPLADEFLDLCSIHGESNPGERKLARSFLNRIENGEVGAATQETKPW